MILNGASSPWGTRAPNSSFTTHRTVVYALPLVSSNDEFEEEPIDETFGGNFVGGGAAELMQNNFNSWEMAVEVEFINNDTVGRKGTDGSSINTDHVSDGPNKSKAFYSPDVVVSFGVDKSNNDSMEFIRRSFLITQIPASNYIQIYQFQDDLSLVLVDDLSPNNASILLAYMADFPSDSIELLPVKFVSGLTLQSFGLSTNRKCK